MHATQFEEPHNDERKLPVTTSVPIFGLLAYGLNKNGSYEAAKTVKDGRTTAPVIPTIEVQGKKRVPIRVALREIAGNDPETLKAITEDFAARFFELEAQKAMTAAADERQEHAA